MFRKIGFLGFLFIFMKYYLLYVCLLQIYFTLRAILKEENDCELGTINYHFISI